MFRAHVCAEAASGQKATGKALLDIYTTVSTQQKTSSPVFERPDADKNQSVKR